MRAPLLAALLLLAPAAPVAAAAPVAFCELYATQLSASVWCSTLAGPVTEHVNLCPPNARCRFIPLAQCVVGVPGPAWCDVLP